jgi:hypothetical protein
MSQELVPAATTVTSFKPLTRAVSRASEDKSSSAVDDFTKLMQDLLSPGQDNKVSEEDLFAGLIQERIKALKGDEGLAKFKTLFDEEKAKNTKSDGYIPVEVAARNALKRFVTAGNLTKEEGDKLHSEAFSAAQLDDNKLALFDGKGGANDPTMAVELMEKAILMAKAKIDAFGKGTETAEERKLDDEYNPWAGLPASAQRSQHSSSTQSGPSSPMDGPDNFLFKPVSDSDGRLVVLLPKNLTGDVQEVVLKNRRGKEIEAGMYRGIGNGDREHFRFRSPGQDYPKNITVEVTLKNGETKSYKIPDPSKRYD